MCSQALYQQIHDEQIPETSQGGSNRKTQPVQRIDRSKPHAEEHSGKTHDQSKCWGNNHDVKTKQEKNLVEWNRWSKPVEKAVGR